MKNITKISIFILLFSSCNEDGKKSGESLPRNSSELISGVSLSEMKEMTTYKNEVLHSGKISSYKKLQIFYADKLLFNELLFSAIIMANKYGYTPAYYDVFKGLKFTHPSGDFKKLDSLSKKLATYYLLKAHELGDSQALYQIKELLGSSITIPKSTDIIP